MKFKIRNQEDKPEEEIEFWLEIKEEGDLALVCDKKGIICRILVNGELVVYKSTGNTIISSSFRNILEN